MKKIKQLALFVLSSILVFNMENVQAKEGYGLNIFNEGSSALPGYTIQLQVYDESVSKPLYTQTIDVSKIPPSQPRFFHLGAGFKQQIRRHTLGSNKTVVSLWDNNGEPVAVGYDTCNFEDWRQSPVLQIKLNAEKGIASVDTRSGILGFALIEAPRD